MKKTELISLLVLLSACAVVATTGTALGQKLLPPDTGFYQGAYLEFGDWGDKVDAYSILDYEDKVGRYLTWAYFSNHWKGGVIRFPMENVRTCEEAGVLPFIRIMPWSRQVEGQGGDPLFNHQDIIDGRWDDPIKAWAQEAKSYGKPLMVEFGPEANGDWFPWNGRWHGADESQGYGDPTYPDGAERFRDAYRHIIELFRNEGAANITWIFHIDSNQSPDTEWNMAKHYYPGDEYIDWIGISVFGAQQPSHPDVTFSDKLGDKWDEFTSISTAKPILITEFAVIERQNLPSYKADWVRDAVATITNPRFERIKGMAYWNTLGYLADGSASMRIDSSDESLQVYRNHVSSSLYDIRPKFSDSHTALPVKAVPLIFPPTAVEVVGIGKLDTLLTIERGDIYAAGKTYLDIIPRNGVAEGVITFGSATTDLPNQLKTPGSTYLVFEVRGPNKAEQAWQFSLYHPGTDTWQIVGDNAPIESWEWNSYQIRISDPLNYISDGKIHVKISSEDHQKNFNIDYAVIKHFGQSQAGDPLPSIPSPVRSLEVTRNFRTGIPCYQIKGTPHLS